MTISEGDRCEVRAILMTIASDPIANPEVARMAQRGVDLLTTEADMSRLDVMRAPARPA